VTAPTQCVTYFQHRLNPANIVAVFLNAPPFSIECDEPAYPAIYFRLTLQMFSVPRTFCPPVQSAWYAAISREVAKSYYADEVRWIESVFGVPPATT
jgi:hypothetical protein